MPTGRRQQRGLRGARACTSGEALPIATLVPTSRSISRSFSASPIARTCGAHTASSRRAQTASRVESRARASLGATPRWSSMRATPTPLFTPRGSTSSISGSACREACRSAEPARGHTGAAPCLRKIGAVSDHVGDVRAHRDELVTRRHQQEFVEPCRARLPQRHSTHARARRDLAEIVPRLRAQSVPIRPRPSVEGRRWRRVSRSVRRFVRTRRSCQRARQQLRG